MKTSDIIFWIVLTIIYIIAAITGVNRLEAHRAIVDAQRVQLTQEVCDISHGEINGYDENTCALVQDYTNTEYLCNKTGISCWVEAK